MQTLCIKSSTVSTIDSDDHVKKGEIYNIIDVLNYNTLSYYKLSEKSELNRYNSNLFIPLSITEGERYFKRKDVLVMF